MNNGKPDREPWIKALRRWGMVFLSLLLAPCAVLMAAAGGGQPGALFTLGASARSVAMGRAFVGVADDASATFWNPAGLAQLDRREATIFMAPLFGPKGGGTSLQFVGFALPTPKIGTLGLSIIRLASTGFEEVEIVQDPSDPLNFDFKETGGKFALSDMALSFSYAKDVARSLSIGANLKYLKRGFPSIKLLNGKAEKGSDAFVDMDIAIFAREVKPGLSLGFTLPNILSFKMSGFTDDRIPRRTVFGASFRTVKDKLLLALDIDKTWRRVREPGKTDFSSGLFKNIALNAGMEYWVIKAVAFRAGINVGGTGLGEASFGFGFKRGDLMLDTAMALAALGIKPRVSLNMKFGRSIRQDQTTLKDKFFREGLEAFRTGNYVLALSQISRANDIDPRDPDILKVLPKIQKIATLLASAGAAGSPEAETVTKGLSFYMDNDLRNAVETLRYAYDNQPENDSLRALLNRIEQESGLPQTGKKGTEAVLREVGQNIVEKKQIVAQEKFYNGDFQGAIDILQEILFLEPKNALALQRMGSAFYALGFKEKALGLWGRALSEDPTNRDLIGAIRQAEEEVGAPALTPAGQ